MKLLLLTFTLLLPLTVVAEPVKYADRLMLESKVFGEPREIMISLPESFEKSTNTQYPVVYVVRGQLDLLSVVAAINMLDAEAPELIVVGVSGTGAEFFPTEEGEQSKFSELLHNEVVPYIEKEYRTAPYNILLGHSAAGKFVVNDWLGRGGDFSSYYAISPELHDGAINARAKSVRKVDVSEKGSLLISMGREDKRMQTMFDELESLSTLSETASFIQFEDQTHMSGRVHTVMAGLRGSFENWRPSREIESGKFEVLQMHYKELSERYGYEVSIPIETMKRLSAFDSASKDSERWENASKVVKHALAKTPEHVDEFVSISDEMVEYGMVDGSKRLMSYICEQSSAHVRCNE